MRIPKTCAVDALVVLLLAACGEGTKEPADVPASLILFTVDALRADQLGAYGMDPSFTPHCDRLAAESLVFDRAFSQASLTHPALTSMLSGLLPWRHAVIRQGGRMHEGAVSVTTLMSLRGYATGSFVANLCKLQDIEGTVFHDGWDERWCGMAPEDAYDDHYLWDQRVVTAAMEWIAEQDGPYFCWVHLMDPHAEHRPDPALWDYEEHPVDERFEQYRRFNEYEIVREMPPPDFMEYLWGLYAAEVRAMDRELGRFLAFLDGRADRERTALIFSADHGEELYESWSRYDHGLSMSEGVLWVPLMIRAPGLDPGRSDAVVETLQVTPTILELCGVPLPYALDGRSLLSASPSQGFALSFSETVSISLRTQQHRYWFRNTSEPWTRKANEAPWRADAPWFREKESLATYDDERRTAPIWLDPHAPENEPVTQELFRSLNGVMETLGPTKPFREIDDPELKAQLKALGYTEGD